MLFCCSLTHSVSSSRDKSQRRRRRAPHSAQAPNSALNNQSAHSLSVGTAAVFAATDTTWVLATLLDESGSAVVLLAVVVISMGSVSPAVKDTTQAMDACGARLVVNGSGVGVQAMLALAGAPVTTQLAASAAWGPLLVQVAVNDTFPSLPGVTVVGVLACISA